MLANGPPARKPALWARPFLVRGYDVSVRW